MIKNGQKQRIQKSLLTQKFKSSDLPKAENVKTFVQYNYILTCIAIPFIVLRQNMFCMYILKNRKKDCHSLGKA